MSAKPVIRAIVKRDLKSWFSSPTGYVFITIFVLLCAFALFIPPRFFQENTAGLASLSEWFRFLLLFFVPAITMVVWAGERSRGTDEILLTLPAADIQVVVGKFMAAAGIYTLSLAFTFLLPVWLELLGDPDWGLILSGYLAFWCLGVFLISVGMIGSQVTDNLTVAFILGGLFCALVVFTEDLLGVVFPTLWQDWFGSGPIGLFNEMVTGLVTIKALLFFLGGIVVFLALNVLLLSRGRGWGRFQGMHLGVRFGAVVVGFLALVILAGRWGARVDLTSEGLHTLSDQTVKVIDDIDEERPVTIRAWVSPEIPRDFVPVRRELLDLLKEYDSLGGDRVLVDVIETKPFSDAARYADSNFGIRSRTVYAEDGSRRREFDVFLAVAVTCGAHEVTIPFLDRGLSVEYELTRSLRVAAGVTRPKVGVLDTDVKMFGGMNYQTYESSPAWEIVRELRLQYEVVRVNADEDYPSDLKALIVGMCSSLTQAQMDRLANALKNGLPALLFDDPFPNSAQDTKPSAPKLGGPPNPMNGRPGVHPDGKGDSRVFYRGLGIDWEPNSVAWDSYNPHPDIPAWKEWIFVGAQAGDEDGGFNPEVDITSGLQEVLFWFGGSVRPADLTANGARLAFVPLLSSTKDAGHIPEMALWTRDMFGRTTLDPDRTYFPSDEELTLACMVRGKASKEATSDLNVVFFPDIDMINLPFLWTFRREGEDEFQFDNVTLVLNAVDHLMGESSFIALRKRRQRDRTLTTIEEKEAEFRRTLEKERDGAEADAKRKLEEAQERLEARITAIEENRDLDERAKAGQIEAVRQVEQRRFGATKNLIEDEKKRRVDEARGDMNDDVAGIQNKYRFLGIGITPIPAILAGLFIFFFRWNRERLIVPGNRSVRGGAA